MSKINDDDDDYEYFWYGITIKLNIVVNKKFRIKYIEQFLFFLIFLNHFLRVSRGLVQYKFILFSLLLGRQQD